jgi:hypothetical protein
MVTLELQKSYNDTSLTLPEVKRFEKFLPIMG